MTAVLDSLDKTKCSVHNSALLMLVIYISIAEAVLEFTATTTAAVRGEYFSHQSEIHDMRPA